ncbi:MAG: hypothetical protein CBD16_05265 [Betaproteobacteria bacterium TMED156]|nr:MAG: hypothetical protein CBD16_05265 [Betaproteobacteria bacterium TMED156]|tara:strand:- start:215 stop:535 length:321 start_codon:yes stop_codon:yes gene_type:complete
MTFIWFCLISYGLTQILVYGKIFDPIRPKTGWFGQLLKCPMCTGFWVGLFLWFVKDYTQLFTFDNSFVTAFLLGCASSAAAYLGSMFMGDDGIKVEKLVHIERSEK